MTLANPLIYCGYTGGGGKRHLTMPVLRKPVWSEQPVASTPTNNTAPKGDAIFGEPAFSIVFGQAVLVAISAAPNLNTDPLSYCKENEVTTIFCDPGDKIAWKLA